MPPGVPAENRVWPEFTASLEFRSGVAENFQHTEIGDIIVTNRVVLNDATV